MTDQIKYLLDEDKMPTHWYNIMADLKDLPPILHPGTFKPVTVSDLEPIFAKALAEQELSTERYIEIPEAVRQIYKQWRPSPLYRARRLEEVLGTPAKIYYKYEGVSPAGSHKPNSAIPQAYYNKLQGITKVTTETGAGQWGASLSLAGSMLDLAVRIFMVRVSYNQKPYRRAQMELLGGDCIASPSNVTEAGRDILAKDPNHPGSLGIAISEAIEVVLKNQETTRYTLGSVLNHVMLHQSIVGQEAIEQMKLANDYPDVIIGSAGGGSNLGGIAFPFLGNYLQGKAEKTRIIAVEPAACPTLTRGVYAYDFGDTAHFTPLLKMYTLGSHFTPPGVHAGGLRFHGMSPLISAAVHQGYIEPRAYQQIACFEAGTLFAQTEGIVPAPEATHPICATIEEALRCKKEGKAETILFNFSGHGHFDMQAYMDFMDGKLQDMDLPEESLKESLAQLPKVPDDVK